MFSLEPMDEAAYEVWRAGTEREVAKERVLAGNWPPGDAERLARASFERNLPLGLATPGQELRAMVVDGQRVGDTWFLIAERDIGRVVFIYDIAVDPEHRRRGYARLALAEIERYAREHGCVGVMLQVFGWNTGARELYRSEGFVETNVHMLKRVDGTP